MIQLNEYIFLWEHMNLTSDVRKIVNTRIWWENSRLSTIYKTDKDKENTAMSLM